MKWEVYEKRKGWVNELGQLLYIDSYPKKGWIVSLQKSTKIGSHFIFIKTFKTYKSAVIWKNNWMKKRW